jgi:hypothetical protein
MPIARFLLADPKLKAIGPSETPVGLLRFFLNLTGKITHDSFLNLFERHLTALTNLPYRNDRKKLREKKIKKGE